MSDYIQTGYSEELKPCPFCGGAAKVIPHSFDLFITGVNVVCTNCGARTAMFENDTLKHETRWAVEAWNRREK